LTYFPLAEQQTFESYFFLTFLTNQQGVIFSLIFNTSRHYRHYISVLEKVAISLEIAQQHHLSVREDQNSRFYWMEVTMIDWEISGKPNF
jgi:hypothetical protein